MDRETHGRYSWDPSTDGGFGLTAAGSPRRFGIPRYHTRVKRRATGFFWLFRLTRVHPLQEIDRQLVEAVGMFDIGAVAAVFEHVVFVIRDARRKAF